MMLEEKLVEQFAEKVNADVMGICSLSLNCPKCGGVMIWEDAQGPDEFYGEDDNGMFFTSTERYSCDECGAFADITQVYVPKTRLVAVSVPDEEDGR